MEREGERAKLSIKQVLEQKRINDATGALVKELFANVRWVALKDMTFVFAISYGMCSM